MLKSMRDNLIYLAIFILSVIFLLVLLESAEPATISTDGKQTIMIDGPIYSGDAARLTKALGEINIETWLPQQQWDMLEIIIDSRGGDADVTQTMMYILNRWSNDTGIKIRTICYARAGSGGALLFLMGDERWVGDLAVIMIHEVWFEFAGGHFTTEEMLKKGLLTPAGSKATLAFNALMYQLLREKTTVPPQFVKDEYTFSAGEAYRYNLATHYKSF